MRHQKLTEAEECRLGRRAYEETKRRIRARVLKAILDERTAARKRDAALAEGREPEDAFTWQPQRRR